MTERGVGLVFILKPCKTIRGKFDIVGIDGHIYKHDVSLSALKNMIDIWFGNGIRRQTFIESLVDHQFAEDLKMHKSRIKFAGRPNE